MVDGKHQRSCGLYLRMLAVVALGVAGAGILLAGLAGVRMDRRMRETFLHNTADIAGALPLDLMRTLTFTPADAEAPAFAQIRSHMRAYATVMGLRSLYSMAWREGEIVFGPESLDAGDPYATPPGTVYQQPSVATLEVFRTGRPQTVGPERDEFGDFVSALVPLIEPRTGAVIAVIGCDVEAEVWRALVRRAWGGPLAWTLGVLTLLGLGVGALCARARRSAVGHTRWRYLEALLCLALGLVLTCAVSFHEYGIEALARGAIFASLARAHVSRIQDELRDLNMRLRALGRFFEASDVVDRQEFLRFTKGLSDGPFISGWAWIPAVPAEERAAFEAAVRAKGEPAFELWELDDAGRRGPAQARAWHYPARYISPPGALETGVGFDLASEDRRRTAIEAALQTGLSRASAPVPLVALPDSPAGVMLFRPTSNAGQRGVVLAGVELQALALAKLGGALGPGEMMEVGWFRLDAEGGLYFLTSSEPKAEVEGWIKYFEQRGAMVLPLVNFGESYLLMVRPTAAWWAAHPLRSPRIAFGGGLALTLLATLLAAMFAHHRADMEAQVARRTAQFKESELRLNDIAEHSRTIVWETDEHGVYAFVSPVVESMLGYRPDELVGRVHYYELHPEEGRAEFRAAAEKIMAEQGRFLNLENPIRTRNGSQLWVSTSGIPMLRPDGTLRGYRGVDVDITERRRTEAQLQQAQKMESVARLAGGVAHDFNNMLQVILGNAEMALGRIDSAHPLYVELREIEQIARRSADLTRQLLAFARRQTIAPRVLDLNETIAGLLQMLKRIIGEHIQLVWRPEPQLWRVKMDPSQIDQVLANLVVNARDAMKDGGVLTITLENCVADAALCESHPEFSPGEYVRMSVSDTGVGMDRETMRHVFEPFFTTKKLGEGTGLGLATVHGIAGQNKGHVLMYSEPGHGTTVHLYFPRDHSTNLEAGPSATPPDPTGTETILLVEDEAPLLKLTERLLVSLGYTVIAAGDPRRALELAENHQKPVPLLVTDVVMPGMNGRELSKRLTQRWPRMKTLYVSGYSGDVIMQSGVIEKGVNFLEKPFTRRALALKIRAVLRA
jgi:PAS domain S-box-containing protein